MMVLFPLSYFLSILIYFIFEVLPAVPARIVLVLLPLLPLRSLDRHLERPELLTASTHQEGRRFSLMPNAKFLISLFAYGMAVGYQRGFMLNESEAGSSAIVSYFFAIGLGALAISLIGAVRKEPTSSTAMYQFASIVTAVSLLFLSYLPSYGSVISSICIGIAYIAFDLAALVELSAYAQRFSTSRFEVFSFGYAASRLGMAIGMFAGLGIEFLSGASNAIVQAFTMATEIFIMAVAMLTFSTADSQTAGAAHRSEEVSVERENANLPAFAIAASNVQAAGEADAASSNIFTGAAADAAKVMSGNDTPAASPRSRAEACERLAKDYDLSNREREVLALMLEGRNTPYIEKELCISESTVKTHRRHIYEKLGVHSLQEVLDMADAIE